MVSSGTSRGFNGVTAANLRLQGSNATLVLLNGRRVAQAALGGAGVVDLNSTSRSRLIKRVEVLKDGASSIYGTEAIGGVINFILRDDYQGLALNSGVDVTQEGGGNIYRFSAIGGYGDLNKDHFNLMATLSVSKSQLLKGTDRSWVNTQQPRPRPVGRHARHALRDPELHLQHPERAQRHRQRRFRRSDHRRPDGHDGQHAHPAGTLRLRQHGHVPL